MRGNEFLDKIELIEPAYLEAADINICKKKFSWVKWGAVAACLVLIITSVAIFSSQDNSGANPDLPMLSISDHMGDMGYEGYMAHDISELTNANPWDENTKLATLPVYKNALTYEKGYLVSGGDFDKMREFILDVAERLGIDTSNLAIYNAQDEYTNVYTTNFEIEAEGMKIEVDQTMTAKVDFDPAIALPKEYNFTHHASYDDTVAVAEYLKTKYKDFIGIDNPQVNIHGGDYNIYNRQGYHIEFFNAKGNQIEKLINYNFNRVTFYCDDEGKLFIARIFKPDLSQKVGDYPIINTSQAREMLLSGNYLTTVPYELPGEEYIKKVELVYMNGQYDEYHIPYYRFYVELPEEKRPHGLKSYGAYYVPAVESSYISNMPIWEEHFN